MLGAGIRLPMTGRRGGRAQSGLRGTVSKVFWQSSRSTVYSWGSLGHVADSQSAVRLPLNPLARSRRVRAGAAQGSRGREGPLGGPLAIGGAQRITDSLGSDTAASKHYSPGLLNREASLTMTTVSAVGRRARQPTHQQTNQLAIQPTGQPANLPS